MIKQQSSSRNTSLNDILTGIRREVRISKPLIHCITNPISINDCANAVLAVGGRPIMAEHPKEVAEITRTASTLCVNLGNITDTRMESMMISGAVAKGAEIPSIIDVVGIGCSSLRYHYAMDYISTNQPSIIKGNMSEIRTLYNGSINTVGIDVNEMDSINEASLPLKTFVVESLAIRYQCTVIASGLIDIISDGTHTYYIRNGHEKLTWITGTGCMLTVLTGSYLSTKDVLNSAILAVSTLGICGELAKEVAGPGSFRTTLLDSLFILTDETYFSMLKIEGKDGIL
ncbi:MAG TPA: hydroxyethylthiazole kinase [Lachnospiraceae bacterium]|nr:hydroxyethylthiazole kinase [Lachnospiraceae bacterium]